MQIIGGAVLLQNGNGSGMGVIRAPTVIPPLTSGDANVSLGTTVEWSSNTWLYIAEGQANVRSATYDTVNYDTNNMVYQLCYAHRSIRLPVSSGAVTASGGGARWSTIVRQGGSNTVRLYGAVANVNANLSDFKSNTDTQLSGNYNANYIANTLFAGDVTTQFTVPANRFFLIGVFGGPYYKNYRKTANNYTAVNAGNAIVTVLNKVYVGPWPTGATSGIPRQIGGNTSNYNVLDGNILLAAFKFEVV